MMKTGLRGMETIDYFSKGDFHSVVRMKAILAWVQE